MKTTVAMRFAFRAGWHLGRLFKCLSCAPLNKPTFTGGSIVFIVKADHPEVPYTITPPQVTDSEGNPLPVTDLAFTTESSNSAAVEVIPDPDDPLRGKVAFGRPNPDGTPSTAAVTVLVSLAATGALLGSFGAQFPIPAGDPAAIVGGTITFEGLTEV